MIKQYLILFFVALPIFLSGCHNSQRVQLATPENIRAHIQNGSADLLLVHVWATWCAPCREEFSELVQAYDHFSPLGVQFLLISTDEPGTHRQVARFLADHHPDINTLIATELSEDTIQSVSSMWSGTLPATFLFRGGIQMDEWEGARSLEQYHAAIHALL